MACRLWDYIPSEHTGPPQLYVVHAWSGTFQDMVDALVYLAERDEQGGLLSQTKNDLMCWIDIFAVNHNSDEKDAAKACSTMEETMSVLCTEGSVVLALDHKLRALSQTWCLYELVYALRAHGKTRVQVAIPCQYGILAYQSFTYIYMLLSWSTP